MTACSSGLAPVTGRARHIPVLLSDVLDALQPKPGETYIDGTFGAGGYTRAILEAADCRVLAFDRDPTRDRGRGCTRRGVRDRA